MQEFRLIRPGNIDLVFSGICLSNVSSRESTQQLRWTEIRVYRTSTGRYVSEIVGRSIVKSERDRIKVTVAGNPDELKKSLTRVSPEIGEYLTDLAIDALTEAGKHDPSIAAIMVERV